MEVSPLCQAFIQQASANNWLAAAVFLNGLNMYEMLRSLKALDASDIQGLRAALSALSMVINSPRIEYALTVVETKRLPANAPGDLQATGQVREARRFVARPRSILREPVPRARLAGYNAGINPVNNALMQRLLGAPRSTYGTDCQPVSNTALRRRMIRDNVGPFSVTGLDFAVDSLRRVMTAIQRNQRLVYRVLGTAGMLCVRYVRGSTTHISNHSWGTAIDLTLAGELDERGDNDIQFGLSLIAPHFNAEGWYWGAAFRTEDAMHFECGRALVEGATVVRNLVGALAGD